MLWTQALPPNAVNVEQTRRQFNIVELPDAEIFLASVVNILANRLGYRPSMDRRVCVLGDGRVVPMMSYGLIEYLLGLDLSAFSVLEIGGGGSTQFWATQARSVVTLETNAEWVKARLGQLKAPRDTMTWHDHSWAAWWKRRVEDGRLLPAGRRLLPSAEDWVSATLHVFFRDIEETPEMWELLRNDKTVLTDGPATPGIERVITRPEPIDRTAARVVG